MRTRDELYRLVDYEHFEQLERRFELFACDERLDREGRAMRPEERKAAVA